MRRKSRLLSKTARESLIFLEIFKAPDHGKEGRKEMKEEEGRDERVEYFRRGIKKHQA